MRDALPDLGSVSRLSGHRRTSRHRKPSTAGRTAARAAVAPTMAATMLLPAAAAHASTATSSKAAAQEATKSGVAGAQVKASVADATTTAVTTRFKGFASRPTVTRVVTSHPVLNRAVAGGPVSWVQRRLGVTSTGIYDAATVAAVRNVQRTHGLKVTGVVDSLTWSVMGVTYRKSATKLAIESRAPGSVAFGNLVIKLAAHERGARYRHGGSSPGGFDCSGFVGYVYKQLGISLPRTAAAMRRSTTRISASQVRRGDLVFVTKHGRISHVAIYAGNGVWYESSKPGIPVGLHHAWTNHVSYGRITI